MSISGVLNFNKLCRKLCTKLEACKLSLDQSIFLVPTPVWLSTRTHDPREEHPLLRPSNSDAGGACGIPIQRAVAVYINTFVLKPRNKQCEQHSLRLTIPGQLVQLCSIRCFKGRLIHNSYRPQMLHFHRKCVYIF